VIVPVIALGMSGCSTTAKPVTHAPTRLSTWSSVVNPFPVSDSTGRLLELAFVGGVNLPRPQLVDLDGDGDLDLVVQEYSNRMMHFIRDGTAADGLPRFRLASTHYAGVDVGEWSRFADIDGDGVVDLFGEWPNSYIRYWRGAGPQPSSRPGARFLAAPDSLRDAAGTAVFTDRQNIPYFGDIDCDGVPDMLIGRITGVILQYTLAAATPAPVFRLVTDRWQDLEIITGQGSMHGANTMALADYDGDGDLDLLWGDFFEAGLLLFRNVGTCREPRLLTDGIRFPENDPVVTSGYNAPAFGDLDGDGAIDLVMGVLGGAYDPNRTTIENLFFLARAPDGRYLLRTRQLLPMLDVGSESIPSLVDLDGDGDLDLLLANKIDPANRKTSRIYVYRNTGTRTAPAFRLEGALTLPPAYHYAPAFGDLDGDGIQEMLLGSFGATLSLWKVSPAAPALRAVPALQLSDSAFITITRGSNTTPALGDVDGDGDLDLFIGEASGTLNFYRNDGSPTRPAFTLVSDQFDSLDVGRRSAPHLVDIDGDGDLDLLVGSDDQGIVLFRNEGTRSAPRFVRDPDFVLEVPPVAAPTSGDVDGDGRLELIVGTAGGGAVYLTQAE
jgi:hypothetical protein